MSTCNNKILIQEQDDLLKVDYFFKVGKEYYSYNMYIQRKIKIRQIVLGLIGGQKHFPPVTIIRGEGGIIQYQKSKIMMTRWIY